ncbi:RHS repeat-associated core domain-containing protein [Pseudomonas sp. NPDC089407]|uniref:RHS repeat-associated core domain-containing protein n=1 Tax=Pseudomonas sp. NPDC089407 TaxID=3364464 RepID=UPI00384B7C08
MSSWPAGTGNKAKPQAGVLQSFYCNNRLSTELQGASGVSIIQGGGQIVAQHRREGGECSAVLLAGDQQGSVLNTFLVGSLLKTTQYSAYGFNAATSRSNSILGFNGERPDLMTQNYLLGKGYRGFSPAMMRFVSADNMSPFARGGLNSYAYCLGDPINLQDPSGHFSIGKLFSRFFNFVRGKSKSKPSNNVAYNGEVSVAVTKGPGTNNVITSPTGSPRANPRASLDGTVFEGYHGSVEKFKNSLEAGIKPQIGGNDLDGAGFYFSRRRSVAERFSKERENLHKSPAQVFEVRRRQSQTWQAGVDFDEYYGASRKVYERSFNKLIVRAVEVRRP